MIPGIIIGMHILSLLVQQVPDSPEWHELLPVMQRGVGDSLPVYGYEIVNEYPHDTNAFTQGLFYQDSFMYESTGLYGQSSLRKVEFTTGTILKIHSLDSQYFGEGMTIYHDTIRQLTWRNDTGFIYVEYDTFECIGTFSYTTQGWGLTHNDTCLIMSDGTPIIHFIDPHTYLEIGQITVTSEGSVVHRINELEYIQGKIYANVWYSDSIAVIDPESGCVMGWIDCTGILNNPPNVLNGIAFDPVNARLFVTGKRWPTLFEILAEPINYPPYIHDFFPIPPCTITTDSSLHMGIGASDPDPEDRLVYIWKVNGVVDTMYRDSLYIYGSTVPTIDTITGAVTDGVYRDSVVWVVYVRETGVEQEQVSLLHPGVWVPNPLKAGGIMSFQLNSPTHVRITLFDVTGREVGVLLDALKPRGHHSVHVVSTIAPGVYFIRFNAGSVRVIHKTVIVH